ncbi:MAG: FecR domain-containing protein [Spirochaetota bacterium]
MRLTGTAIAVAQVPSSLGRVEHLEGGVRINVVVADLGQQVEVGDWVQTGAKGTVDIVFDRANVFRLGSNTAAVLNLGESRQDVDLELGTMAAVFDKVRTLSGRGTFDVGTPTAVGGVRGTSFLFRILDSDTTYVCTCSGSLELSPFGHDSFLETAAGAPDPLLLRDRRRQRGRRGRRPPVP